MGRDGKSSKNIHVVQYPEEKRDDRDVLDGGQYKKTFRGVHRLNRDEDGRVRCVACFMCATACPANCIHIEGEESPWEDRKCPSSSTSTNSDASSAECARRRVRSMPSSQHLQVVGLTRNEMVFDKAKLLEVYDQTVEEKPM